MADLEDGFTRRLRGLLRSEGLDVDPRPGAGRGRAGLVVAHGQGRIAVECAPGGPGAKRRAVNDAAKRLAPAGHADAALAVVCPDERSGEGLRRGTRLDVSIVDDYVAGIDRGRPAPGEGGPDAPADPSARARWTACTVAELADRIRNVHEDAGDPDTIVGRLRDAIDAAAGLLSEGECRSLGESAGLGPRKGDWRPAARRALLIVASASMYHARLGPHLGAMRPWVDARTGKKFRGPWNPKGLDACCRAGDAPSRLSDAWSLILAVDRKPIFESGVRVLDALHSAPFARAVKIVANWSRYAAGQLGGTRHDILGRIFHAMLDDAQFDGSFYTSVPAATLLAGLALPRAPPPERLSSFRVVDPACGTGTLLMAAAERLRGAPGGGNSDAGHAHLIESVLEGLDINATALHIAATTLGLLSPTTRFGDMNLHRMPFGEMAGSTRAAAGSLELYAPGGLLPFVDWAGAHSPRRTVTGAGSGPQGYDHSADLVIMNPPYTRNDKRHDQLGRAAEARVKKRESEILAASPVKLDMTSSGLMFLVLGEHICSRTGALACVFPLSSATAPSARGVRRFLAERFDIEYLAVSHDPDREYFSENTTIAELLLVMRRKAARQGGGGGGRGQRGVPTAVVTLLENPSSAGEAAALAADIEAGRPNRRATIDVISPESAADGDWSRVLFVSPLLHRAHMDMREGRLFEAARLGDTADIWGGRDVRGCFDTRQTPDRHARASMYGHDTSRVVSIESRPYAYLVPKRGMGERAEKVWSRASHLLFPEKLRLNLAHVTAACSPDETVGTSWYNVRPRAAEAAGRLRWSKAMAVFLNSTPGIVAVLGVRIPTVLSRPRFSNAGARDTPVPRLSPKQERALAGAYDRYAARAIGRLAEADDPVRRGIDDEVSPLLGIPGGTVERMRRELAREPMCTGRRYGG